MIWRFLEASAKNSGLIGGWEKRFVLAAFWLGRSGTRDVHVKRLRKGQRGLYLEVTRPLIRV